MICDRYVDSSFAYQAYARGLGLDFIEKINAFALEHYLPDATVFIDLSPEDAFQRKHGADENDRLEQAGMAFHKKVYDGYKALASKHERFIAVDGKQTPKEIFDEVIRRLQERNCL